LERFNGGDGFGADDTIQGERLHGRTRMIVKKLLHNANISKAVDTASTDRSMDDDSHLSPLSLGDPLHTSTTAQDRGQRFEYSWPEPTPALVRVKRETRCGVVFWRR
jgi:hypothetical protein